MTPIQPFGFNDFRAVHPRGGVCGIDYLRAVCKVHRMDGDFMVWFARFLWPEFRMVDGRVFVVTLFDSSQYRASLDSGETNDGAQYWMNLLEITGVFDQLSHPQARELAEIVAATWNAKLLADLGEVRTRAQVVDDGGTGEVFVTIGDMSTETCRSTV